MGCTFNFPVPRPNLLAFSPLCLISRISKKPQRDTGSQGWRLTSYSGLNCYFRVFKYRG